MSRVETVSRWFAVVLFGLAACESPRGAADVSSPEVGPAAVDVAQATDPDPDPGPTPPLDAGVPTTADTAEPPQCLDNSDCVSDDACIYSRCREGVCVPFRLAGCVSCDVDEDCSGFDDGNRCNGLQACLEGACGIDPASVVDCPTEQDTACRRTRCDPQTGACELMDDPDGSPCLSSSEPPCERLGRCEAGQCVCPAPEICEPDCSGRDCGPDPECGESCGECPVGLACRDGRCVTNVCGLIPETGCCDRNLMYFGPYDCVENPPSPWNYNLYYEHFTDEIRRTCAEATEVEHYCGWSDYFGRVNCGGDDAPPPDVETACPWHWPPRSCEDANTECGQHPDCVDGATACWDYVCGMCAIGSHCVEGRCEPCPDECQELPCGTEVCGPWCGACPAGSYCVGWVCAPETQ